MGAGAGQEMEGEPMSWRNVVLGALFFFLVATYGFAQEVAPVPLSGNLMITGSSTMAPLVDKIGKLFCAHHPGVVVKVEAGGSERGGIDALEGKSDIGMISRDLNEKEMALFAIPIARDGVALVVQKSKPVGALTREQLLGILTGKISNWKSLGGPNEPIQAATRTSGRGALEPLLRYLGIGPGAITVKPALGDNTKVLTFVATTQGAVAFLSTGGVEQAVQAGMPLKAINLDGVPPGPGSLRDGTWPIARPLNLVTRRVPAGLSKAFIEFALSAEVRQAVTDSDFVPFAD